MIEFQCRYCGQKLSVQDQHSGKRVKCPKCGSVGNVPDKSDRIKFHCENCGQSIHVPQIYAGKKGKCPKCKNVIVVPSHEATPAKSTSMVSFTCSMCDETVQVPETSIEKTVECPGCGNYIETSPVDEQGEYDVSTDEDLYEEGDEEYEESEGVNRRIIVGISAVAAFVVVGLIILVAVLRSTKSRLVGRPQELRTQQQAADTDSRPEGALPRIHNNLVDFREVRSDQEKASREGEPSHPETSVAVAQPTQLKKPESEVISLLNNLLNILPNDFQTFQNEKIVKINILIQEHIKNSRSKDEQVAENAKKILEKFSIILKENCSSIKEKIESFINSDSEVGTCEKNLLALRYHGPIAFRTYLNFAKQQDSSDAFIENCNKATIKVVNSHWLLLEYWLQLENRKEFDYYILKHTLQSMREISSVVKANDLPAFIPHAQPKDLFAFISQFQRIQKLGQYSLRAMISLQKVLIDPDPNITPEIRGIAIEAAGAACSAHDVFFQAVRRNIPLIEVLGGALDPSRAMDEALKGPASPSIILTNFVTLLKSPDKQNQVKAAEALGQIVCLSMTFVELVLEMPHKNTDELKSSTTRHIFLTGSSCFEAIFALADAATGNDRSLRRAAFKSLNDIFENSTEQRKENETSVTIQPQINIVIRKLVDLLKPSEKTVMENEALNTLLAISSAIQETVSRMETVKRKYNEDERIKHADKIKDRLQEVAYTTAKWIEIIFVADTDLYTARRCFLILRLYGRSIPKRLEVYFDLLNKLVNPESEANLPVKRLVTKEALEAFQNASGAAREFDKEQLRDDWKGQVIEWANYYRSEKKINDLIIQQNLEGTDKQIDRLIREGYSIQHRLWQQFWALPRAIKVPVIVGVIWGLLIVSVILLWLIIPWQLAMWAMDNPTSTKMPAFSKNLTKFISLVQWLGCSNRALDSWCTKYRDDLIQQTFTLGGGRTPLGADEFNRVDYLIDHYMDLGNQRDIDTFCSKIQNLDRTAVWIEGEGGGSGKTTLACYMAHKASVRSQRTVIPVIINVDWKQSLLNSVREACQIDNYWLTMPMIRNLAGRGRIILIIDGLSEIREDLNGEHLRFRHILVTSRKKAPETEALFRTVKVGSLAYNNRDQLEGFISRYAGKSEKKIREWAQKLIKELGDPKGQIRPIFAWLAVEYARNNIGSENKKGSISHHELVMQYVELLRSRGKLVLSEDCFRRSAELAAYTEICENWSPRMVPRDTMQSRLREKGKEMPFRTESNKVIPGDVVLEHLEQCGLLQSGSARQSKLISKRYYISFTYDLVAEHLAVEHIFGLPELPPYTKKEIEESGSEFAKIFETVQRAHFPISSNK